MVGFSSLVCLLTTSAALAAAAPTHEGTAERRNVSAPGSCTYATFAAIPKSLTGCSTIVLDGIAVPASTTLDLTKLAAGTKVVFSGTTTFGYAEWSGPLISVAGSNIQVSGSAGNVIDGGGSRWWDGKGSNGGKTKPKFFFAHGLKSSAITGLNFKNSPVQLMSINGCTGLTVTGINFDNSAGNGPTGGHNTDAFDVGSSTDVTISGAKVVNQDDCLAINSGTGITFTGGSCTGGHGLSIGSVGGRSDNTVSNVVISSSSISNSKNGVRIKTVSGATGMVSNIVYKDITLSGISDYGIVIEQDYKNGSPTGIPTTGVPITGLTLSNIKGSVTGTQVLILCASCSGWTWSDVALTGGKKSAKCVGVPTGATC